MNARSALGLVALALSVACGGSGSGTPATPSTPAAPCAQPRPDVEALLRQMTLDGKIGQMTQAERSALRSESDIKDDGLGSVLSGGGSAPPNRTAAGWVEMYERYQSIALLSRLRIPLVYGVDAVHVERVARATAEEVAATGIDWTFSPCVAVARDERWGRTYESFGETPELVSEMGAAAVRGYQSGGILACAKHYLGDGGTTGGRDQGDTRLDETTLRAVHLPGYRAAVAAGAGSVMASFSSWNGRKMHGNRYLLTDVLKGEMGFGGFVVSDWAGIDHLPGDYASDVETAVNAGIDMVMVPDRYPEFISTLRSLVQSGRVPSRASTTRCGASFDRRSRSACGSGRPPIARSAVRAVKGAGVPVVVVLVSGRPMILDSNLGDADAIVAAWLPGTEGAGVADVLFGDYAPSGKLSHSWPRAMPQIPINWGDAGYDPLFPYGLGLTY